MLRGVHFKFNFSLSLTRVDLKIALGKEERIGYHLQFFLNFFCHPLFSNRFLKKPELCRRMVRGHFSSRRGCGVFQLLNLLLGLNLLMVYPPHLSGLTDI
jgi:hypothetical protein